MNIQSDSTKVTFTQVYQDVKQGVEGLAEALKVGAEHVYQVLIRQQIVDSITWTVIVSLLILSTIVCGKIAFKNKGNTNDVEEAFGYGTFVLGIITVLVFLAVIDTIVTGFVNPEYGAMKEIMEFVK